MKTLLLLPLLALAACDSVRSEERWEYRCTSDSTICWWENVNDSRNTPENAPVSTHEEE